MGKGIEIERVCVRVWGCVKVSVCSLKLKKRERGKRAWERESLAPISKGFTDEEVKGLSSRLKKFHPQPSRLPSFLLLIAIVQ